VNGARADHASGGGGVDFPRKVARIYRAAAFKIGRSAACATFLSTHLTRNGAAGCAR
jgi:hypothetical protein